MSRGRHVVIRTHVLPCKLRQATCDALNLYSGRISSGIVSRHWRVLRHNGVWLSEKSLTKLSDMRWASRDVPMHAHSIDVAQQGFFKACKTTRALRKAGGPEAHFPWRTKKLRTTIWKNTAITYKAGTLELSTGAGRRKIRIALPQTLPTALHCVEVRLVFERTSGRYPWHVVLENGTPPRIALGTKTVSVDPGAMHPAVIGDAHSATVLTCRERRALQRGHAKNLQAFSTTLARKTQGSRTYRKLVQAKARCKAKYAMVMRDIAHKISHAIVVEAIHRQAQTIVYGDIRTIADGINKGKAHNQRTSQWHHGTVRAFVQYKAQAEGIAVVLQDEHYTSQTCPHCGHRHKPRGRVYTCGQCGFSGHRDVVGQINILSAHTFGVPGKMPAPTTVKYRIPHNVRVLRKCQGTGQTTKTVCSLDHRTMPQEAAGL